MHLMGKEFRRSTLPSLAFLELTFAHLLADSITGIQPTIKRTTPAPMSHYRLTWACTKASGKVLELTEEEKKDNNDSKLPSRI